jgi:Cu-processing system permease protein
MIYTVLLFLIAMGLFQLDSNNDKALMGLLSVVLIVVPVISLIFTAVHYYNSYEFIELLLSQPQSRSRILFSEYLGTSLSLLLAYISGAGLPILIYSADSTGFYLLASGAGVSLIFCSLAFLVAVHFRDKAKGIGVSLLLWFYFAIIYDGLLLLVLFSLSDYPVEKLTFLFSGLNPIDLVRIMVMLKMDIGALMGYTGALYKNFLGKETGLWFTGFMNLAWVIIPLYFANKKFVKKDL